MKLEAMMSILQNETTQGMMTPTTIADNILNITGKNIPRGLLCKVILSFWPSVTASNTVRGPRADEATVFFIYFFLNKVLPVRMMPAVGTLAVLWSWSRKSRQREHSHALIVLHPFGQTSEVLLCHCSLAGERDSAMFFFADSLSICQASCTINRT